MKDLLQEVQHLGETMMHLLMRGEFLDGVGMGKEIFKILESLPKETPPENIAILQRYVQKWILFVDQIVIKQRRYQEKLV